MVICLERDANDLHIVQADATATPSSLALLISRMVYLSGAGLPRLSWKKAVYVVVVVAVATCEINETFHIILNVSCVYVRVAVRELQGSVSKLTLIIINDNSSESNSSISISIPADASEITVSNLQPNTFYSSLLTVTVHGGHNITSQPATTRTTSGGQQYFTYYTSAHGSGRRYYILPMKFLSYLFLFFLLPQDLRDGSTDREPF